MKKTIYFFAFLISNYCFGQSNILTDSILKPGIYLSVDHISNNHPIDLTNLKIKKDSVKYGTVGNTKYMTVYALDITKDEAKRIGNILGFCDGKNIYLSPFSNSYSKGASFHKTEKIGHFLYFNGIKEVNMPQQNLFWLTDCQNLVDLNKKELVSNLTNGKLKKIISNNKELLNRFKKEKKKSTVYRKYLKEYCEVK
ncbi:hypothetical protein [Winogradskyella flava]|uniref:Uncharacterized protein n=1 Tax=Winogradskyella flava TaxID=1884876 RepID=A0A842ITD4_9FLAO|nr:hypothetical protein [Winogradskyella flava]MBC2845013.1 hypothetical protein [Winogradskyella flava]